MNHIQDTSLVRLIDGEPKTDTLIVAEKTGNQHKNVLALVRDGLAEFEQFGRVAFETRPFETSGGVQSREVAQLNEPQATLLVTYLRNTEVVRALKVALVRDFYAMRQALNSPAPVPAGPELVALALVEANKMLEAKDEQIAVLEPKARAWDHIVSSEASWSFNDAAKVLFEHKKIVVGEKRLFKRCVEWGYLYRDHKGRPHAYQRCLEQGLFSVKARTYTDQETGQVFESSAPQVRITGKGLDAIFRRLTDGQLDITA